MSKLMKIAAILAVAAVVIAAKQFSSPGTDKSATALTVAPTSSISPADLMRDVGALPETQVDSYF